MRAWIRKVVPLTARVWLRRWPEMIALARLPAAERGRQRLPFVHCERETPLKRERTVYGPALQQAKEQNVARAAALLDGVTLAPGALFSWHRALGPPVRLRGFAAGPELHDDRLASGGGGGLCQVANLVFWLAVHGGLKIIERHRHALDLFPDDARTTPFGSGATVFFPHKDLKVSNPHPVPVQLELRVEGGVLRGALRFPAATSFRCELVERHHRFVREGDQTFRENQLFRRTVRGESAVEEALGENRARVLYPVEEN